MYRKEEILSLLKDPTNREANNENDPNEKPPLKWHKVWNSIDDLLNCYNRFSLVLKSMNLGSPFS